MSGITGEGISRGLLPRPQKVEQQNGVFRFDSDVAICLNQGLNEIEVNAVERFVAQCNSKLQTQLRVGSCSEEADRSITFSVSETEADSECRKQGYELRITPKKIDVCGNSDAGLFNAIQTLNQLAAMFDQDWPCMIISDFPAFPMRGLSFDVSRGKVPTLDTLKELADHLASIKVNHLQLYVEHTFDFKFNPDISKGFSPLTADEIRQFDEYCVSRRIELVPSVASFGHMGAVLSLPEYRHLAEIETGKCWKDMTWRERMRGLTLDATNPESRELLTKMYDEYLPLFSSNKVNICGDETYDLAKGKSKQYAEKVGVGQLYLEHIHWLRDFCRKHDKQIIFWGDMIKKYPELIEKIPDDAIVAHWDYIRDADYKATKLFCDAGLTTYVCPGTSAWNRMLCDINTADINIRRFAQAGHKYGAEGVLNTDWGDDGHVNPQASAWHPIYLGACVSWNVDNPNPEDFDRSFGKLFFGDEENKLIPAYRELVRTSDIPRTWPEFYLPLIGSKPETEVDEDYLATWREASLAAANAFARHTKRGVCSDRDVQQMEIACRLNAMVADRMSIARKLSEQGDNISQELGSQLSDFADACEAIIPEYEKAWLSGNKPSCLHEITAVFKRLADEARTIVNKRNR